MQWRCRRYATTRFARPADGHDGTWVAHPGLVPIAMEVFNEQMPDANQLDRLATTCMSPRPICLTVPSGPITEAGLRININVGTPLPGKLAARPGCVPIFNLMEDAATCEIRAPQIWQWIRHPNGVLDDGRKVTVELFRSLMDEELARIAADIGAEAFMTGKFPARPPIFDQVTTSPTLVEFLTLPAYEASSVIAPRGGLFMLRRQSRHARYCVPASMGRRTRKEFSIGRDWSCRATVHRVPTELSNGGRRTRDGREATRLHGKEVAAAAWRGAHRATLAARGRRTALGAVADRALCARVRPR